MFVSKMLNSKLDIKGSSEVEAAGKVFTDEMGACLAGTKATVWEVLPGLAATKVLPGHNLQLLSAPYEEYPLFEVCRHTTLSMWSLVWRNWLHLTDPKTLLTHECGRPEVSVQRSTICHGMAENGVFTCRTFEERDGMGPYYVSQPGGDLGKQLKVSESTEQSTCG